MNMAAQLLFCDCCLGPGDVIISSEMTLPPSSGGLVTFQMRPVMWGRRDVMDGLTANYALSPLVGLPNISHPMSAGRLHGDV